MYTTVDYNLSLRYNVQIIINHGLKLCRLENRGIVCYYVHTCLILYFCQRGTGKYYTELRSHKPTLLFCPTTFTLVGNHCSSLPVTAMVPSRDMSKQVIAMVCGFLDNGDGCLLMECVPPIFLKFQ